VRQNSNFHLLREAYQQILNESSLPPVGPGVCYFKTGGRLTKKDVTVETTTGKWEFIKQDEKIVGVMSTRDGKTPSGSITDLGLGHNQITSFDGSGLSGLIRLNLYNNQLSSFDSSGLSALDELDLSYNRLTSFNGHVLSSLTRLSIKSNQITSFDGSGLTALNELDLSYNQLTSFDSSGLTNLNLLDLYDNMLTSFDSSELPNLYKHYLTNNPFHNLNGPAVILPDGTKEYWIDGKKCENEHDYEVARAKYLRPQEAAKVMKDAAKATGIADLEGLWDDL
jgi:Leucine-rich repeat (LRR) protein